MRSKWLSAPLGKYVATKRVSVDPSMFPDEVFDLYSIPAFDTGEPDVVTGSNIGSTKQLVEPGDVLLSKIIPHIRRSWVVGRNRGRRLIASGEWIVFRGGEIKPQYLRHFLVGDPFHSQFMQTVSGVGGSLMRARPTEVAKILVPVPPMLEQERIVRILGEADGLQHLRREADHRTAVLIPAIFHEMFGDPATNPKGWPTEIVGTLLDCDRGGAKCGPFGSALKKHEYVDSGIPVWGIPNVLPYKFVEHGSLFITPSKYEQLRAYSVESGDLLVSRAGTVGRICVARPSMKHSIIGTNLVKLVLNEERISPDFFAALLTYFGSASGSLRANTEAGSYSFMNTATLKTLKVILPPLQTQQKFVGRVIDIRAMEERQTESRRRMDDLAASLLHRALAGEL